MTEQDIQSSIRLALSPHGVVFRTNSGDFWQGQQVMSRELLRMPNQPVLINLRKVQGLPKGFPDLIYYGYDGQAGFVEVKRPGEKPKIEQEKFIALMQGYGYLAGVARSDEDALKIILGGG